MKKFCFPLFAVFLFTACQKESAQTNVADENAPENVNTLKSKSFIINLTGANEVPGPGDPDGSGTAEIVLDHGHGTISYTITTSGLDPVTGAHIHRAPASSSGPIVVHLSAVANGTRSGVVSVEKDLIKEIRNNPELFYVNVHTTQFRPGAIRGQLSK